MILASSGENPQVMVRLKIAELQRLDIETIHRASLAIILFRERIKKVLIRLRRLVCKRKNRFISRGANLWHLARGYETSFILNSAEHEISNAHKYLQMKKFLGLSFRCCIYHANKC